MLTDFLANQKQPSILSNSFSGFSSFDQSFCFRDAGQCFIGKKVFQQQQQQQQQQSFIYTDLSLKL